MIVSEPRLVNVFEAFNFSTDPAQYAFTAMLWKQDGDFYYYRQMEQNFKPSPEADRELFQQAVLVPRDYYLAKVPAPGTATRAASIPLANSNIHFKTMTPFMYDPTHTAEYTPADMQADEMRVCEVLRLHPHPNICQYLGYVLTPDGNNVAGLCFERHGIDLFRAVEENFEFDVTIVVQGVRSGVKHLHSLGYAHVRQNSIFFKSRLFFKESSPQNDINPRNIILDKNALPLLIDFDSCQKIGESLKGRKGGTVDWDHESEMSLPENDYFGLGKVEKWLAPKERESSESE
jgi:serine/threonine protein kinase